MGVALLAVAVGAAALAGCTSEGSTDPGPAIVQGGAPGETSRPLSADEARSIEPLPYVEADVEFMQGMIHHHAQALVMTEWAAENSGGDQVPVLAQRMEIGQSAEIELMGDWLAERGEDVPSTDPGDHEGMEDMPMMEMMPGMLSDDQLEDLRIARGPEFDRLFLEYMIQHHTGALTMVDTLVEEGGSQEIESGRIASDIYGDQEIEILRMQGLLGQMDDA